MTKFDLGTIAMTQGVQSFLQENELPKYRLGEFLNKHQNGDWGELSEEDCLTNEVALKYEERIFSAYSLLEQKIWIITEWDRSVTTLLLPSEY